MEENKPFIVTNEMIYNALQDTRKRLERQEQMMKDIARKVEQYSARVALTIDGDTKNEQ